MVVYGLLRLALVVRWARDSEQAGLLGRVVLAANIFDLVNTIALVITSFSEHRKSIRPSTVITLYLLISTAFDAVECRTLWLRAQGHGLRTTSILVSVSLCVKLGVLVLETVEKRPFLQAPWNLAPPESLSGAINRSVFWWLNALFLRGYKGIFSLTSLWATDYSMSSERLLGRLSSAWNTTQDKTKKRKKHALALSLIRSIKWPMAAAFLPRLCLTGLRFCQPLLLKRIVDFVGQPDSDIKTSIGYGLIGATALVYFGNGVSNLALWFLLNSDIEILDIRLSKQCSTTRRYR